MEERAMANGHHKPYSIQRGGFRAKFVNERNEWMDGLDGRTDAWMEGKEWGQNAL
jgi:hypothetical protein